MVKVIYPLDVSPEYEKLKAQFEQFRGEYSELITRYQELLTTIIPNVAMDYMLKIGRREHQLFTLQVKFQQLKREINLYQAALNRGERLSQQQVDKIIRQEFNEYQQQLRKQEQQIKEAEKRFSCEKMSPQASKEIRKLFLALVKKLHPDLHPDFSPLANNLWNQVMEAYEQNNLAELKLLTDMTAEMIKNPEIPTAPEDAIVIFRKKIDKMLCRAQALEERLQELQKIPPLSYVDLLADANQVLSKRVELEQRTQLLEEQILTLQSTLAQLRGS
ncbi:MAG: J domain-containing protein [Lentisphaeria bacterium]